MSKTELDFRDPKDANQYKLDLIAVMTLIMNGFVTHPRYNEMVQIVDPQNYINLVRDEFRQINTYVVGRCIAGQILDPVKRYSEPKMRDMLIEYGSMYAESIVGRNRLPSWKKAIDMFDELLKKHYDK